MRSELHDVLLGYRIPADSFVLFPSDFCHRHPDLWEEPEAFRSERFTPEAVKARHRYASVPFSAGPRTRIGKRFALIEVTLALVLILARYRLELTSKQTVGVKAAATSHPDRPIILRLTSRGPGARN